MFALTQSLRRAVQIRPNGISTISGATRRTWTQTADRVARIAGTLSALGVRRGDRIAILALNSDRYFELLYAVPWIGAVAVPLNTRLAAPEIEYILEDSGAVALFVDVAMSVHLPALAGKMPAVHTVVWLDDTPPPKGAKGFEELTNHSPTTDVGAHDGEIAGLFYTGGTTGRSKGVMLTHTNLVVNALNAVAGIGFNGDTTYIHSGPMFHLADTASTFAVTMAAGRHVFIPRFDPVDTLAAIQAEMLPLLQEGTPEQVAARLRKLKRRSALAIAAPGALNAILWPGFDTITNDGAVITGGGKSATDISLTLRATTDIPTIAAWPTLAGVRISLS